MAFFQEPPRLESAFATDRAFRAVLRRLLPNDVFEDVAPSLARMGELAAGPLYASALASRLDEPRHVPFDAWGQRVDLVEPSAAWKDLARLAATEGLIGTAYERRHGAHSRIHQFALVFLFAPSSQSYSCPLAMTDGAARTLEVLRPEGAFEEAFPRLIARDPALAWTSGQWMTERAGGSDVGLTETVARPAEDGAFRLHGTKWFTSAITSDIAITLGRPEGAPPGGKGLALFYARVRDAEGRLNGLTVHRLKDKLGTRLLPTAELLLDGTVAQPIAGLRDGIRNMANMLNLTRTWNAVCAVASMQRGLALARDYARRRVAFGATLADKPLHAETLADLAADYEVALALTFHEVKLLGKSEVSEITKAEQAVLSVLHPLNKLFTGKLAVGSASEVLECFGGAGYVEDTGLPALLRDAQVFPIWEGTTNVLSLETLRSLTRDAAWEPLLELVKQRVGPTAAGARVPELAAPARIAHDGALRAIAWARDAEGRSRDELEAGARRFAFALASAVGISLLVEHAEWSIEHENDHRAARAAHRFAARGIDVPAGFDQSAARGLALGDLVE
jgi:alkylation response protein AidB-like acyl-CoA dehydrogenase